MGTATSCCFERERDGPRDRRIVRHRDFFTDVPVREGEELPEGGEEYTPERIEELVSFYNARVARPAPLQELQAQEDSSLVQSFTDLSAGLRLDTTGRQCTLFRVREWYINNKRLIKIVLCATATGLVISVGAVALLIPWAVVKGIVLGTWLGVTVICTSIKHIIGIGTTLLGGATIYAWLARQYQRLNVAEQEELGLRNEFRNAFDKPPRHWVRRRCSHEDAGNERSIARKLLVDFAIKHHGRVFVVDGSMADSKQAAARPHVYAQSRHIYTDKDAHLPQNSERPRPGDAVVMIDCDYHREHLAEILIRNICYAYTMTPSIAGGPLGNATLSIGPTAENGYNPDAVTVTVSGGAKYTHGIWDYSCDNFSIGDMFGRTVFLVEHHKASDNRSIVMIMPVAWLPHLHWGSDSTTNSLYYITKQAKGLQRCKYNTRGVIHVHTMDSKGVEMVSLGLENTTISVSFPYRQYRSAHSAYRSQKVKDNGFAAILAPKHDERPDYQADIRLVRDIMNILGDEILPSMHNCYAPPAHTPMMQRSAFLKDDAVPKGDDGRATQVVGDKVDHEDAVRTGRNVHAAIIPGGCVLDNTHAARENSVQKKLLEVRAKNDLQPEEIARWEYIAERFCENELGKYKHSVTPLTLEEVQQEMTKPAQKAMFEKMNEYTTPYVSGVKGSAFIKKEPAGNPGKCARIITQAGDQYKGWWARYTLAIAFVLKKLPYWLPGKTPAEIAQRVHEFGKLMADNGVMINCSDSSSHDGHRSMLTIRLCAIVYKFVLVESELEKLVEYLMMQTDRKVTLTGPKTRAQIIEVLVIWIVTALGSGMNDTTISNTLSLIFPAYGVLLEKGIQVHRAWNEAPRWVKIPESECGWYLGGHGGDDTMNAVSPEENAKNNAIFENVITVESYTRPDEPLTLLARTFVCPRDTNLSHSDIRRTLSKIHFTVTDEHITDQEVFARKGLALAVTDGTVPVLGNLSKLYLRSAGVFATSKVYRQMKAGLLNDELSYQARCCIMNDVGFPQAQRDTQGLVEHFISQLGGSPTIVDELCVTMDACNDIRQYVAPFIPGKDWVAVMFTMLAGNVVVKGQGIKDGLPFLGPGDSNITYSVYDLNWGKPPRIDMPETHRVVWNKDESHILTKMSPVLLDIVKREAEVPYFRLGRLPYRPGEEYDSQHKGQLKLFLSLLKFSVYCGGFRDKDLLILGSNPGLYLPFLRRITGLRTIHTYDVQRPKPKGSDRHRHSALGTVCEENIDAILQEHDGWLVYSDIRRSAGARPTEDEVEQDNIFAATLAARSANHHLMLKFRCCFDRQTWMRLPDKIFLQPFAPQASTETRFYYAPGERLPSEHPFDSTLYEQRMAFFNRVVRPFPLPAGTWEECFARSLMVQCGIHVTTAQEILVSGKFPDEGPAELPTALETVPVTIPVEELVTEATPTTEEPEVPVVSERSTPEGSKSSNTPLASRVVNNSGNGLNPHAATNGNGALQTVQPPVSQNPGTAHKFRCKICKGYPGHETYCRANWKAARERKAPKEIVRTLLFCTECNGTHNNGGHRRACSSHPNNKAPSSSSSGSSERPVDLSTKKGFQKNHSA